MAFGLVCSFGIPIPSLLFINTSPCSNLAAHTSADDVPLSFEYGYEPLSHACALIPTTPADICDGGVIANPLSVNVSGGTGTISYSWDEIGGSSNPVGTNPTYDPGILSPAGIYEYQVTVDYDGNGCDPTTSNIVQINVEPDPFSDDILNIIYIFFSIKRFGTFFFFALFRAPRATERAGRVTT